jgi:hypothetical protein
LDTLVVCFGDVETSAQILSVTDEGYVSDTYGDLIDDFLESRVSSATTDSPEIRSWTVAISDAFWSIWTVVLI